ncbi:MAG: hypothetical protein Q9184_005186 [Pyrenodesmia sp. 2 TL-2023]
MSTRLNDYQFLQQNFIQNRKGRQNSQQHNISAVRALSDTSANMDVDKVQTTPPTPYLGDNESNGDFDDASNTKDTRNLENDNSQEDAVKDERALTEASGDEGPVTQAEDSKAKVDPVCAGEADGPCTLGSGDHRKVVSHVFGRNKRCTHQIPEDCWIKYCRKHYQRQKYRCPADWFETQLILVDGQIDKMEAWGGISSWTIAIRKREREILDNENAYLAQHGSMPAGPLCRERFLVPYLGSNKSFADIRNLINVINKNCDDTGNLTLPSFELLPVIDERRNPRPKRGAARRPSKMGTPAAPSTFRLATDAAGQIVKVEAPVSLNAETSPVGTPARIPSTAPGQPAARHTLDLAKTAAYKASTLKRPAASFEADDEGSDNEPTHPAKRHRESILAKKEAKSMKVSAHPSKLESSNPAKREKKKPEVNHAPILVKKDAKPGNTLGDPAMAEATPFAKKAEPFGSKPADVFKDAFKGASKGECTIDADEKKLTVKDERTTGKAKRRSNSF